MSRVVELHHDWMSDPAFRQEFARLEEELKQLKAMSRGRGGKSAVTKQSGNGVNGGAEHYAAVAVARQRSA